MIAKCHLCDAPLFADALVWGGMNCGDCIAARIQLSLMGALPVPERRPMRRTSAPRPAQVSPPENVEVAEGPRRVIGG